MKGSASMPSIGNDERHALRHEPGDESAIAGKTVELGDDPGICLNGRRRAPRQAGTSIKGVSALSCLDLDELGGERETFCFGETADG